MNPWKSFLSNLISHLLPLVGPLRSSISSCSDRLTEALTASQTWQSCVEADARWDFSNKPKKCPETPQMIRLVHLGNLNPFSNKPKKCPETPQMIGLVHLGNLSPFSNKPKKCPETPQMIRLLHLGNLSPLRIFTFCLLSQRVCLLIEEIWEEFNLKTKFPFLIPGKLLLLLCFSALYYTWKFSPFENAEFYAQWA